MKIFSFLPEFLKKPFRKIKNRYKRYLWRKSYKEFLNKVNNNDHIDNDLVNKLILFWGNVGYSSGPEYIKTIIHECKKAKHNILECGSGLSTLIMAPIAKEKQIKVISLEHHELWRRKVQDELKKFKLDDSTLYLSKLKSYDTFDWYDIDKISIDSIDLCICDAPPGNTRGGRIGLVHLCKDKFNIGAKILVDDIIRNDEKQMIKDWSQLINFQTEEIGQKDKHAVLTILKEK